MSDELIGSRILELLEGLDRAPLIEDVRDLYEGAYERRLSSPQTAIEYCQKALTTLEEPSQRALGNPVAYARGQCYLLIASILSDRGTDWESAEEHYLRSQEEFHSRQLSHLESLAYLGLAIARRKLKNFDSAMRACKNAQDCVDHESIPRSVETAALREAINNERLAIQQLLPPRPLEREKPAPLKSDVVEEKQLIVFDISAGMKFYGAGGVTNLNFFSREDYEHVLKNPRVEILDLVKCRRAQEANYILEIDEHVSQAYDGINKGDWLLIRSENDPNRLDRREVAVLLKNNNEISVSLKTLINDQDHYFLKAKSRSTASVVIIHYDKSENSTRIRDFYQGFSEPVNIEPAYKVRVIGEVIEVIQRKSIEEIRKAFLWRIPIVNNIAAGLGDSIAQENIVDYALSDIARGDVTFGVVVEGDSMKDDGILPGRIALIHQQEKVENGEIAAVVITTPGAEPLGVLKWYSYEKRAGLQYWLLKSSNPASEHLLVIPSGANVKAIQDIYNKEIQPIKTYENAELAIAGKYIGLCRREPKN